MSFDAFISYSHGADGELAPAVQRGLQRLAKPWTRRQALRIFRDDTGLSVSPALWTSITNALDESDYFILMASPGAAESVWVNREIEYWLASRPDAADRILPVLSDGTWAWDEREGDIDWAATTAAPAALAGVFRSEPRHLDLGWARTSDDLDLHNPRFRDAIADLAAPIHGIPKDELESEDVRQHRKALLLRRTAVAALAVLLVGVASASVFAVRSASQARAALSDLEDANGNIDELRAEGELLAAANEQAASELESAEAQTASAELARARADELATRASEEAEEATEQAAHASEARLEAERLAEEAVAEAEDAASEAEEAASARDAAVAARTQAEEALTAAERAEAEAVLAQEAAQGAQARAEAERDDVNATLADVEAQTRAAQADLDRAREDLLDRERSLVAAQQQLDVANAAVVDAEAAQTLAEELAAEARAAEAAAVTAEAQAVAAAAAADQAAERAAVARAAAELAAAGSSLSLAAANSDDPAARLALAAESYCAVAGCDTTSTDSVIDRRRLAAFGADVTDPPPSIDSLRAVTPMWDALVASPSFVGGLPGWNGRAVDVAASSDGATIAALADDGRVRIWSTPSPNGVDYALGDLVGAVGSESCDACVRVTGIGLTDDGTTFGYVTRIADLADSLTPGAEMLHLVDVASARAIGSTMVRFVPEYQLAERARLVFDPQDASTVALQLETGSAGTITIVTSPSIVEMVTSNAATTSPFGPAGPPPGRSAQLDGNGPIWLPDGRLATFTATEIHRYELDELEFDFGRVQPVDEPLDVTLPAAPVAASMSSDGVALAAGGGLLTAAGTEAVDWVFTELAAVPGLADVHAVGGGTTVGVTNGGSIVIVADDGTIRDVASAVGTATADVSLEPPTVVLSRDGLLERHSIGPRRSGGWWIDESSGLWGTRGAFRTDELVGPDAPTGSRPGGRIVASSQDGDTVVTLDESAAAVKDGISVPLAVPAEEIGFDYQIAISPSGRTAVLATARDRDVPTFVVVDTRTGAQIGSGTVPKVCPDDGKQQLDAIFVSDVALVVQSAAGCRFDLWTEVATIDFQGNELAPSYSLRDLNNLIPPSVLALAAGEDPMLYRAVDGLVRRRAIDGSDWVTVVDAGLDEQVTAVAMEQRGGRVLAVGFESGAVELWDVETGRLLLGLPRHERKVVEVAVSTREGVVTVSSRDRTGVVVVHTVDDGGVLRSTICSLAGRALTSSEWSQATQGTVLAGTQPPRCDRGL